MTRLHNHKSPTQSLSVLSHEPTHTPNQSPSSVPRKPDQDDTRRDGVAHKDQPTEVLVLRQENALLAGCLLNHLSIIRALSDLAHRHHIMALSSQSPHYSEVTTLVRQEAEPTSTHHAS